MVLKFVETDQSFTSTSSSAEETLGVIGLVGQFERGPINVPTRVTKSNWEAILGNNPPSGSYGYYAVKGVFNNYAQALLDVCRAVGSGYEEADSTFASKYLVPYAFSHDVSCKIGGTVTIALPFYGGQDEDPEYEIVTQPSAAIGSLGELSRMDDGSGWMEVVFTPDAGAEAAETATFTYRVYDGVNYSSTATCTVTIRASDATDPYAYAGARVCCAGDTIEFSVEGVDYSGGTLTAPTVVSTGVTKGNLIQTGTTLAFTYEVPSGQSAGTDSFTFTIQGDSSGESAAATFTLTVIEPTDHFTVQAAYNGNPDPGIWAQESLGYAIEHVSGSATLFNLFLYLDDTLVGSYRSLSAATVVDEMGSSMYARIVSDTGLVATASYVPARPDETPLDSDGNFVPILLGVANDQVTSYTAGADGDDPVEADFLGTSINGKGIYSWEVSGKRFALLGCCEAAAFTTSFATSLKAFCQSRKMGRGVTINGLDAEYAGTSLSNIANLQETSKTYFSNYGWAWGKTSDGPSSNIPLMGHIMGMTVRSWSNRGHWKSAAGLSDGILRTVDSLSSTPRDLDEEVEHRDSGVNIIKMDSANSFAYVATCRTLSTDDKFKHGSRRDFLTWLVPRLNTLLGSQLEEPNVASLIAAVRDDKLLPFFRTIQNQATSKSQCFKNNSVDTDIEIEFVTVSDSQTDVKISMNLADPLNDMTVYLSQQESTSE